MVRQLINMQGKTSERGAMSLQTKDWPQPLKAPPRLRKGRHSLQSHTMGSFAKDGLPCPCVVALAVVGDSSTFPAESTILVFLYIREDSM